MEPVRIANSLLTSKGPPISVREKSIMKNHFADQEEEYSSSTDIGAAAFLALTSIKTKTTSKDGFYIPVSHLFSWKVSVYGITKIGVNRNR